MSISRQFNQLCKENFQKLGFILIKSKITRAIVFVRLVSDVLQSFTLKISNCKTMCTVEFGVFPICINPPLFLEAGGYELDDFLIKPCLYNTAWEFNPGSDMSIKNCLHSIIQTMKEYLIPFLDKCTNSQIALYELLNIERTFDQNRQTRLRLSGCSDQAKPWYERSLTDTRKYYMALKSQNWDYASKYLEHRIEQHQKDLTMFDDIASPRQPEIVKNRTLFYLSLDMQHQEMLRTANLEFFSNLLKANERKVLDFINANYSNVPFG